MPTSNRKIKPKNDEKDETDTDFPSLSQQSGENDEQQLRETLEKYIAADLEKKKAQKEKKFLDSVETHFNNHIENSARDVRNAMKAIDGLYTTFLMEYAACEDRIQKKYLQLQALQANLVKMAKEGAQQDEEANKTSNDMQIKGLSKTRTSCTAFNKILAQLRFEDEEEIEDE